MTKTNAACGTTETSVPKVLLVFGFPRSGTTWFANLLNTNPDVIYRHEFFGRSSNNLDAEAFRALKEHGQMTDVQYAEMIGAIVKSRPDTDRPPFFRKNHCTFPLSARKLLWMAATTVPALTPLYAWSATSNLSAASTLVIKETGWTDLIGSIIQGFRNCPSVLVLRHPCAVVASHLRGTELGHMRDASSHKSRDRWIKGHCHVSFYKERGYTRPQILSMDTVEYLAIRWRFAYDCFRSVAQTHDNSVFVVYEDLVRAPSSSLETLCKRLALSDLNQGLHLEKFDSPSTSLFSRDSSSSFFSVLRSENVNVTQWKKTLSTSQIDSILNAADYADIAHHWSESET